MPALRETFAYFGISFDPKKELAKGNKNVQNTEKSLGKFDKNVKSTNKDLDESNKKTKAFSETFKHLGAIIGGAAIVQGFRSFLDSTVESTREIALWSERLGITETQMYGWIQTAARFGGSTDDITDALKELQLKARDALSGTQSYIDTFKMLGISVRDLQPVINDQNALMELFTDHLNRNTDAATQNFVTDELMSDAGTRLLGMFRAGTTEIRRYRREAEQAGGRNIPQLVRVTREYTMRQRELVTELTNWRNAIALRVIPLVNAFLGKMREVGSYIEELAAKPHMVEAALISMGAVAAVIAALTVATWGPPVAAFLAVTGAVAGLGLGLQDLYQTVEDPRADTATRRFLEMTLGAKGAADAIEVLNQAVRDLRRAGAWLNDFFFNIDETGQRHNATQVDERGMIQVTNIPSFLARAVQTVTPGWDSGIASGQTDIQRNDGRNASRMLARRREQRQRDLEMWGIALDLEAVVAEQNAEETSVDPMLARRAARRRPMARPSVAPSTGSRSVSVQSPTTINVTVNEATDAAAVGQQVRQQVRAEMNDQMSALSRSIDQTLVGDGELAALGGTD